ncbi:MAG: hypothetical protein SFY67_09790 [Candidatus Melainabacteria bacterium]|nr:hypothetical protein [Candidatus Melainabacteria bacterium]
MVENQANQEVAEASPKAASSGRDGSDATQIAFKPSDNPLQIQATNLLTSPDSRDAFRANTVSLAAIDQTSMTFRQPNWGTWDNSNPASQFDQLARAEFPQQKRDVTDNTNGSLDPKLVTDFTQSMKKLAEDRPQDKEIPARVNQFLKRVTDGEIKPADAARIMNDLMALQRGDGVTASGIQNADTRRAFVSGLLDNLAQPEKINQTGTNTCNATTVQEQLYKHNPAEAIQRARRMAETGEYTAYKVDAKGERTNEQFTAKLPPSYFNTMDQLAKGDQTDTEALNVATSGVSVGMLNHFYQQRGLYYNIEKGGTQQAINGSDTNGEYLAKFTNGAFTQDKTLTGGPDTDAYAVADMGRAAGLKGAFVFARDSYLRDNREHTGVARIKSDADMQEKMDVLQRTAGVNSAIMVMNVGHVSSQIGGHVVSITRTPDRQFRVSDQNKNSALENEVRGSSTLFAWMNNMDANRRPTIPPSDQLDKIKPGKSIPMYDRPGIISGNDWNTFYGDNQFDRYREQQRIQDQNLNQHQIKKADAEGGDADKLQDAAIKQAKLRQEAALRQTYAAEIRAQISALEARLSGLQGALEPTNRSQVAALSGKVADLTGDLMKYTA